MLGKPACESVINVVLRKPGPGSQGMPQEFLKYRTIFKSSMKVGTCHATRADAVFGSILQDRERLRTAFDSRYPHMDFVCLEAQAGGRSRGDVARELSPSK